MIKGFLVFRNPDTKIMKKYSLSLVVACRNEEELLEDFLKKSATDLARVSDDFEIVLVDDGSVDKSLEIEQKLAKILPQLKIIALGKNLGTGANYIPGFRAATKDIVFWNTVDAFYNTEDLPRILPYLDRADVVSCYRTDLKANNFYQRILTLGNYFLIRFLFPLKLRSYQTLQFHRRQFLQGIKIEAGSSFISPEFLLKAAASGLSILEVPFVFQERLAGRAKGGKLTFVWRTFKDIIRFWWRWVVRRQPLGILGEKKYYLSDIRN